MQLFFVSNIEAGEFALPAEEARHAIQVLRKRIGDQLDLVDGKGGWYRGSVIEMDKRSCLLNVEKIRQENKRASFHLTLAVSPTKSNDRFEWFLEKATEIGIDAIIPLQCKRTERPRIRVDRYEKVLVAAMKQSLQAWLPKILPLTPFEKVMADIKPESRAFIGWCDDSVDHQLTEIYKPAERIIIFIGPEGDFTTEEVNLAKASGCLPIALGHTRLRTETAALVATQSITLLQQMNKQ